MQALYAQPCLCPLSQSLPHVFTIISDNRVGSSSIGARQSNSLLSIMAQYHCLLATPQIFVPLVQCQSKPICPSADHTSACRGDISSTIQDQIHRRCCCYSISQHGALETFSVHSVPPYRTPFQYPRWTCPGLSTAGDRLLGRSGVKCALIKIRSAASSMR